MQRAALEKEIRKSEGRSTGIRRRGEGERAAGGTGERVAYEPLTGRVDAA
jgi:hypothetical protein